MAATGSAAAGSGATAAAARARPPPPGRRRRPRSRRRPGTPPSREDLGWPARPGRSTAPRPACAAGIGGDLLGRRALGGAEAGQPVLAAGVAAEVAGHQDRVDVVRGLQHRERAGVAVRIHLARAGEVDRVADARLRPQRLGQRRLGGLAERGHLEPGGLGHVARDHAVPAAVGEDGDPRTTRHGVLPQREQHVGQLARGLHLDRAGDVARGRDHRGVAGERAGVGLRAAGRGLAGAGGEHHDRRAGRRPLRRPRRRSRGRRGSPRRRPRSRRSPGRPRTRRSARRG